MSQHEIAALRLLACSITDTRFDVLPQLTSWQEIDRIARKHAVLPLILQAAMALDAAHRPPDALVTAWKSLTLAAIMNNERLMHSQAEVVSMFEAASIPCAILKGASLARLYPKPEMRALGDIDILVRADQCDRAIETLKTAGYCMHETEHEFHIGFDRAGTYLELHYAISQFPELPVGERIKRKLEDATLRTVDARMDGYTFPALNETDQALSLLLHMERHMVNEGIGLRQLCDWCVFLGTCSPATMEQKLLPAIQECRLFQFASVLTRICVLYLGLDSEKHSWCANVPQRTADELLADILDNGNIMSKDLERAVSSTFLKGEESSLKKRSVFSSAARNLTIAARKQFPICNKAPILLPIFWAYLPVRYLYRSVRGERPKQSVQKIAKYAMKRKKLYRKLELFKR
ncbi:MAG: nucleotidyltransferase family protein [Clostridia bacterium]|nr:nucleotidyltransferase family protein [Clostridia bacterium]